MSKKIILSAVSLLVVVGCSAPTQVMAPNSSLVGSWSFAENGCTEKYIFRSDGTFTSESYQERLGGSYVMETLIGTKAGAKVLRIVDRSNGGADCQGHKHDLAGKQNVRYLVFSTSKTSMHVCANDAGEDCFGPLIRDKAISN